MARKKTVSQPESTEQPIEQLVSQEPDNVKEIIEKYFDPANSRLSVLVGPRLYINQIQVNRAAIDAVTKDLAEIGIAVEVTATPLNNLAATQA